VRKILKLAIFIPTNLCISM